MTTKSRVEQYLDFGYSARRVSELFGWPYEKVKALKLGEGPQRYSDGKIKAARHIPDIDAAVRMVLSGVTVEQAALNVSGSVWEVRGAVAKARVVIDRLAREAG